MSLERVIPFATSNADFVSKNGISCMVMGLFKCSARKLVVKYLKE